MVIVTISAEHGLSVTSLWMIKEETGSYLRQPPTNNQVAANMSRAGIESLTYCSSETSRAVGLQSVELLGCRGSRFQQSYCQKS